MFFIIDTLIFLRFVRINLNAFAGLSFKVLKNKKDYDLFKPSKRRPNLIN